MRTSGGAYARQRQLDTMVALPVVVITVFMVLELTQIPEVVI